MKLHPFSLKELPEIQKKIFRRQHGIVDTILANSTKDIEFIIPYTWAKITTMDIIGSNGNMTCNLTVHADETGKFKTLSSDTVVEVNTGAPKYQLNQFGFNVNIAKDFFKDHSEYDADVFSGMIIKASITNNADTDCKVGINFTLHEVV